MAKDLYKINIKEQIHDIQITFLQSHCDECKNCDEGDCSQSGHCRHSCSFHVYLLDNAFKMNIPVYTSSMLKWFHDGHYISPFLDPSLRPPLFS